MMNAIPILEPITTPIRMPTEALWSAIADEQAGVPGAKERVDAMFDAMERGPENQRKEA